MPPDYLMTHPVTTTRISEAKERAEQIAQAPQRFTGAVGGSDNPLLPERFRLPAQAVAREAVPAGSSSRASGCAC